MVESFTYSFKNKVVECIKEFGMKDVDLVEN